MLHCFPVSLNNNKDLTPEFCAYVCVCLVVMRSRMVIISWLGSEQKSASHLSCSTDHRPHPFDFPAAYTGGGPKSSLCKCTHSHATAGWTARCECVQCVSVCPVCSKTTSLFNSPSLTQYTVHLNCTRLT